MFEFIMTVFKLLGALGLLALGVVAIMVISGYGLQAFSWVVVKSIELVHKVTGG